MQRNGQNTTIRNVSSKKGYMMGVTHLHVEPPPISLIKENHDGKSERDVVKLKLRRDPTSHMSDLYEFKMSLFENGKIEEF